MFSHTVRRFAVTDTEAVVALWRACGLLRPWNDPYADIDRKLTVQPELFLVAVDGDTGELLATGMAGFDGHRGWVNYLAVQPNLHGHGMGRALMNEFERRLVSMGCPKLSLQVREGNEQVLAFYAALGYAVDPVVSLGKRLINDI